MKTIAFISQKGGAGKSTLAVAFAAEACRRGQSTDIIDADPQRSLYRWSLRRDNFAGTPQEPKVITSDTAKVRAHLNVLRSVHTDTVVIDSAGKADADTVACAKLADLLIIPTRPNIYDVDALMITVKLANELEVPHLVVINALHPNSRLKFKEVRDYLIELGATVAPFYIAQRAAYADSALRGETPQSLENNPRGKCTREIKGYYNHVTDMMTQEVAA